MTDASGGVVFIVCSVVSEPEAAAAVARHVEERGVPVSFVCERIRAAEKLREMGFSATYFWSDEHSPTEEELAEGTAAVNDRHREVGYPELHYLFWRESGENLDRLQARAAEAAGRMTKILRSLQPELVVNNDGSEIIRRVSTDVATHLGVASFYLGVAPFPGRMAINRDHKGIWLDNDDNLGDFDAAAFVDQMIRRKPVFYVNPERERTFSKALRYSRQIVKEVGDRKDSLYYRSALQDLRSGVSRRLRGQAVRVLYEELPRKPYIYYPLHIANDTQVTVRAFPFADQRFIIGALSRSLPDGMQLVVKEHPFGVGQTPWLHLREIAQTDRVTLVPPSTNSYDLVRGATAVVVINSTVGFESILSGKPTVVLGHPYYGGRGATIDVADLHELRDALRQAVAQGKISADSIEALVKDLWSASWPGAGLGFAFDTMAWDHPGAAPTAETILKLRERARDGEFPLGSASPSRDRSGRSMRLASRE